MGTSGVEFSSDGGRLRADSRRCQSEARGSGSEAPVFAAALAEARLEVGWPKLLPPGETEGVEEVSGARAAHADLPEAGGGDGRKPEF